MQNFMISFNVVFPIFIMMALGFFIKTIRLVDEPAVKQMNSVVFRILLPLTIFRNISNSRISDVFSPKLAMFVIVSIVAIIALLFIIIPFIEKDRRKTGVLIQAIFRSNFVIFGVPVSEALCGGDVSGTTSLLVAVVIPIFNVFAVVTLEVFRGGKAHLGKIIKGIVTNPLIVASIIGVLALVFGFRLSGVLKDTVDDISSITTPLALIMLGASINFSFVKANIKELIIGVGAKLVLIPAIILPIAVYAFDFAGSDLAIILAIFATPPAVSSFTMAQQMGADDELAGQLVMFGTVLCLVTMFIWIFMSKQLGFI